MENVKFRELKFVVGDREAKQIKVGSLIKLFSTNKFIDRVTQAPPQQAKCQSPGCFNENICCQVNFNLNNFDKIGRLFC